MLLAAFNSGVRITWWRAALHGTSLAELHNIWNHGGGGGVVALLSSWKNIHKVALASIFVTISSLSFSPLLQRASEFGNMYMVSNITLRLPLVSLHPDDYFGAVSFDKDGTSHTSLNLTFGRAIQSHFLSNPPLMEPSPRYFCNGTCTGWVEAPGISSTCLNSVSSIDLYHIPENGTSGFNITWKRYNENSVPTLEVISNHINSTDNSTCQANLVTTRCFVHSGTVRYPIIVQDTIILRDYSRNTSDFRPHIHSGDAATSGTNVLAGPLAALSWMINTYFVANDTIYYDEANGEWADSPSMNSALTFFDYDYSMDGCSYRWLDPSPWIINASSEILFASALDIAKDSYQYFQAVQETDTLIYISKYRYLAIGCGTLILAIMAILSTLWGWWELGRDVTLSPLETARAFGSFTFQYYDETDAEKLAKRAEGRKFTYGQQIEIQPDGAHKRVLQFAEAGVGGGPLLPSQHHSAHV